MTSNAPADGLTTSTPTSQRVVVTASSAPADGSIASNGSIPPKTSRRAVVATFNAPADGLMAPRNPSTLLPGQRAVGESTATVQYFP